MRLYLQRVPLVIAETLGAKKPASLIRVEAGTLAERQVLPRQALFLLKASYLRLKLTYLHLKCFYLPCESGCERSLPTTSNSFVVCGEWSFGPT